MGKYQKVIKVVIKDMMDIKDTLVQTTMDLYTAGEEVVEYTIIEDAINEMVLLGDELDTLGEILADLVTEPFKEWESIIDLAERQNSLSDEVIEAFREFRLDKGDYTNEQTCGCTATQ